MRVGVVLVAIGWLGCDHLTDDLGQSDDDVLSINIPAQQPTSDLGVLTELAVFSGSSAQVRIDIDAGTASAGSGAGTRLCLDVTGGRSQVFVLNVSPTNGSALMRVSLLAPPPLEPAPDAAMDCTGEVRKTIEVIVQLPATNPPSDGGTP